jgi:subtilisin family serine protease
MHPLELTKLRSLMKLTDGGEDIKIGLIDGPIDLNHPLFKNTKIRTVTSSQAVSCRESSSPACMHGTFIAGILVATRASQAPAICPNCELILRPIFKESNNGANKDDVIPVSNPQELAEAIIQIVDAGAKVINLSLGLSSTSIDKSSELYYAYEYALRNHVIIVAAAGNQGNIGILPLTDHPWGVPVAACDGIGKLSLMSNIGPSIGKRGLLAPGVNITSVLAGGNYIQLSGTSVAAPFVTGGIALLWSLFPNATASEIITSILQICGNPYATHRRSIIPRLFDAEFARSYLEGRYGY